MMEEMSLISPVTFLTAGCRLKILSENWGSLYISASRHSDHYFCKRLRDVQGAITRAELLKRLRASLKHEGYCQIPQLECPAAAKKKKLLE